MKRVLFVDDEARVLEGLRDLLRRHRKKWDMVFALGSDAALKELQTAPPDVVVSDMRMPGMDGAALLSHVQKEHPRAVRIILSGYAENEAAMRTVTVAHQFLTKPCDVGVLEGAIDRVCALQELLADERLQSMVGKIDSLPTLPKVHATLVAKLKDPATSSRQIAALLEEDMGMCAKVLQLVNSSFFGLGRRVRTVEDAVVYLGSDMIRNLVLTSAVFNLQRPLHGVSAERLRRHALLVGGIAQRLASDRKTAEDAFLAGVLHDIGVLILASQLPEQFEQALRSIQANPRPLHDAELELWGVSHDVIGAYLLGLWGLPYHIVEAVALHHRPIDLAQFVTRKDETLDLMSLLHIADAIAVCVDGDSVDTQETAGTLLPQYLEQLKGGPIDEWLTMARSVAASLGGD